MGNNNYKLCVVVLLCCLLVGCVSSNPLGNLFAQMFRITNHGDGGGTDCAGCTVVVGLVGQVGQLNNKSIDKVLDEICDIFPSDIKVACDGLVLLYGSSVIKLLEQDFTPDEVCLALDICKNTTCNLFPKKSAQNRATIPKVKIISAPSSLSIVWPWEKVADHLPALDEDGDKFSTIPTLRGYHWRGKDCGESNNNIYPGHIDKAGDVSVDHNCNGIFGVDSVTSQPYEHLLCSNTPQYGYVALGDSASAHFHIPPEWFTAVDISKESFKDMLEILEDEFDWPEQSTGTGYMAINYTGHPIGPVDSLYQRMRQRNLCMHRDFQNLGVNGARVQEAGELAQTMSRSQQNDYPVFMLYAMVANDVCNPHPGMGDMTTPQQFYERITSSLDYLDSVLPPNSHIVFLGFLDLRVMYDTMSTRMHPLGELNKDITYGHMYDYLNCLEISPCYGFMNSDPKMRNATYVRALQLNDVYNQIISNHTYKNFDMIYMDYPIQEMVQIWAKSGGNVWDIIEPVDGMHPAQNAQALLTEVIWNTLQSNYSSLLNPINPNNNMITKIFGDQGGYN